MREGTLTISGVSGRLCWCVRGPLGDAAGAGREVVRNRLDIDAILSGQKPCVLGRDDEYVGLLLALFRLELVEATELVLSLRRVGPPCSRAAPAIRSTLKRRIVGASRCAQ